jgi:hypothetical protein
VSDSGERKTDGFYSVDGVLKTLRPVEEQSRWEINAQRGQLESIKDSIVRYLAFIPGSLADIDNNVSWTSRCRSAGACYGWGGGMSNNISFCWWVEAWRA